MTSLLTTSSEPLVPPVPESAQLPYKVCLLAIGLGGETGQKAKALFPWKDTGIRLDSLQFYY